MELGSGVGRCVQRALTGVSSRGRLMRRVRGGARGVDIVSVLWRVSGGRIVNAGCCRWWGSGGWNVARVSNKVPK